MSGIFNTFHTAVKGMSAQQTAINTSSHNISNANTEGFSRQRVELQAERAYNLKGVGQIGTGVDIKSIIRIRDTFLDLQIRNENGISGEYNARKEVLDQVEMIFLEPTDTGLGQTMSEMWNSWQELSKYPESSNTRTIVAQKTLNFTDSINHMSMQLEDLTTDTISEIEKVVYDIHSILTQVDNLNQEISKIKIKGQEPNDLMDQRDLLMDNLSDLIEYKYTEDNNGNINISISGKNMLSNSAENELSVVKSIEKLPSGEYRVYLSQKGDVLKDKIFFTTNNPSKYSPGDVVTNKSEKALGSNPLTESDVSQIAVDKGEIKGYHSALKEIQGYSSNLDQLAKTIAKVVNTVHSDDGKGIEFLVFKDLNDDGSPDNIAKSITVNSKIVDDASKILAGKEPTSPSGDGSRALAIAQLRNGSFILNDSYDPSSGYDDDLMTIKNEENGATFENYYKDTVIELGISTQQAKRMIENQTALIGQLEQRKESISGVSIDEEVANLVKFQHSYQANAKVIATLTEMLDTLINRLGL